jgi:magnesium-transporting ATPase (P-type)
MDLNDELGQITDVFSDKTGTVTKNDMVFRKLCVGGVAFGLGTTQIGIVRRQREGASPEVTSRAAGATSPVPWFTCFVCCVWPCRVVSCPSCRLVSPRVLMIMPHQAIAELQSLKMRVDSGNPPPPHFNFIDGVEGEAGRTLQSELQTLRGTAGSPQHRGQAPPSLHTRLHHMLFQLACNHTVVVETVKNEDGTVDHVFSSSSPDEVRGYAAALCLCSSVSLSIDVAMGGVGAGGVCQRREVLWLQVRAAVVGHGGAGGARQADGRAARVHAAVQPDAEDDVHHRAGCKRRWSLLSVAATTADHVVL